MEIINNIGLLSVYNLSKNGKILFATRIIRLYAYGLLCVILILYLKEIKFTEYDIGLLLSLTLLGDMIISLIISYKADDWGRKKVLIIGSILMLFSSITFTITKNFILLLTSAIIGVISPSGNEIGPFSSLEQSMLAQITELVDRTFVFTWYQLFGYWSTGLGSLSAGYLSYILINNFHYSTFFSYQIIIMIYGFLSIIMIILFSQLDKNIEINNNHEQIPLINHNIQSKLSIESKKIIAKLSLLFMLDSFAGSLINGALLVYWFHYKFNAQADYLGYILFIANIISGVSSIFSANISKKIGLINTMVFTHLPSNILTILIVLMPNLKFATIMLFIRFSISQMDVAPRQTLIVSIVKNEERTKIMGIVNFMKTLGTSIGPLITGYLAQKGNFDIAFWICGILKIVYDLGILFGFKSIKHL